MYAAYNDQNAVQLKNQKNQAEFVFHWFWKASFFLSYI